LQPLAASPELAPVQPLQELRSKLLLADEHLTECRERRHVLANAVPVPEFADERPLTELLRALAAETRELGHWQSAVSSLQLLHELPRPQDAAPLAELLRDIERQRALSADCREALTRAEDELAQAAEELRQLAETAICPTCGAPLDADRLFAAADASHGGHQHG
jgi:hypothetical protein